MARENHPHAEWSHSQLPTTAPEAPHCPSELTLPAPRCCAHTSRAHTEETVPPAVGSGVRVPTPVTPTWDRHAAHEGHYKFFLCFLETLNVHFYFYTKTNVTLTHTPLPSGALISSFLQLPFQTSQPTAAAPTQTSEHVSLAHPFLQRAFLPQPPGPTRAPGPCSQRSLTIPQYEPMVRHPTTVPLTGSHAAPTRGHHQ